MFARERMLMHWRAFVHRKKGAKPRTYVYFKKPSKQKGKKFVRSLTAPKTKTGGALGVKSARTTDKPETFMKYYTELVSLGKQQEQ
eukprot:COSAG01_NODE_4502_length_4970_cov_587.236707_5_plen_86_part_00